MGVTQTSPARSRDPEIRAALTASLRGSHPGALIVQEWGIGYKLYADVAAIGDALTEAWEIKSAVDSLTRLERQIPLYTASFDRCVLVVDERHVEHALKILPKWWGVIVYGAGALKQRRRGRLNGAARPENLLWSIELKALVRKLDRWKDALERRRTAHSAWLRSFDRESTEEKRLVAEMWNRENPPKMPQRADMIASLSSVPHVEIAPLVCATLRGRTDWRRTDGYRAKRESRTGPWRDVVSSKFDNRKWASTDLLSCGHSIEGLLTKARCRRCNECLPAPAGIE